MFACTRPERHLMPHVATTKADTSRNGVTLPDQTIIVATWDDFS